MKNLLFYGVSSLQGGVETFIFNLIEHFDRNRFKLFLLVNTEDYIRRDWLKDQKVEVIIGPNRRKNLLSYRNKIKKILIDNKIDIVWSNLTSLSDITLLSAAKSVGIEQRIVYSHQSSNMGGRITGHLHDMNKKYRIKKVATDFWACSDFARNYFFKDVIDLKDCVVFVNAVNPKKYAFNKEFRKNKRNELGLNNEFILGTVGRLSPEKNQQFLVRLISKLKDKIPNVHCVIVGSGPKKEELLSLIESLDLKDNVTLLGQRTDVSELINAFDIFVLPSLFEGLPFVLVEAQMNGLNVLVSDQVSLESGFTDRIQFLPLEINTWLESVINIYEDFERQHLPDNFVDSSKFNILNNIKDFESRLK